MVIRKQPFKPRKRIIRIVRTQPQRDRFLETIYGKEKYEGFEDFFGNENFYPDD